MTQYAKQLLLIICMYSHLQSNGQQFYQVEAQRFNPFKLTHAVRFDNASNVKDIEACIISLPAFDISPLVNFGDYKQYLNQVKIDSGYAYYLTQLPDSSILSPKNYARYISDTNYNRYPVAGISFEAAMNYCRWKTFQDNSPDSIMFIYRIPRQKEWHGALNYLQARGLPHDLNGYYSDWLFALYYEGGYGFGPDSCKAYSDFFYRFKSTDPPRMKRLRIIGNSYYSQGRLSRGGYYSFRGYRHIGFRLVKVPVQNEKDYQEIAKMFGIPSAQTPKP